MSTIDQAFINAYTDQGAGPASASNRPQPAREPAPPLRVFAHTYDHEPGGHRGDYAQRPGPAMRAPLAAAAINAPVRHEYQPDAAEVAELTLPSLVGERKPLSAFATSRPAPTASFKPVFEVDEFRWPTVTDELLTTSSSLLQPVVELLLATAHEGRTLVGIGGTNARVGASTVTMCLARLLAMSGHTVALVDANFVQGNLARSLGIEFELGWGDVLAGKTPLAECAIASLADRMTLIPLGGPSEGEIGRLGSIQSSVIAGMLRYHYDVVLFDLGSASDPTQCAATRSIIDHCRLDAGIVVTTAGTTDAVTIHGMEQLNAALGASCLGVIGNRAG